eukprot:5589068-Pyramimonas_sp.AAC.1
MVRSSETTVLACFSSSTVNVFNASRTTVLIDIHAHHTRAGQPLSISHMPPADSLGHKSMEHC